MPFDLRRCAEAAAHAALAEALAPSRPEPHRRRRLRLRPVRTLLLGTGLVTTARVTLDPTKRRELLDALARHFPIQELLDEIVLEADVVPDADDRDGSKSAEREPDAELQSAESDAKPANRTAAATRKPAASTKKPAASAKKPAASAKKPAASAKKPAAAKKQPAGATRQAASEHRRRHVSRQRGDSNGQRRRKPPNQGTRA